MEGAEGPVTCVVHQQVHAGDPFRPPIPDPPVRSGPAASTSARTPNRPDGFSGEPFHSRSPRRATSTRSVPSSARERAKLSPIPLEGLLSPLRYATWPCTLGDGLGLSGAAGSFEDPIRSWESGISHARRARHLAQGGALCLWAEHDGPRSAAEPGGHPFATRDFTGTSYEPLLRGAARVVLELLLPGTGERPLPSGELGPNRSTACRCSRRGRSPRWCWSRSRRWSCCGRPRSGPTWCRART